MNKNVEIKEPELKGTITESMKNKYKEYGNFVCLNPEALDEERARKLEEIEEYKRSFVPKLKTIEKLLEYFKSDKEL